MKQIAASVPTLSVYVDEHDFMLAEPEPSHVIQLTREEIVARIEQGAQRRRGMSARDLIIAYKTGSLEDPGEVADLLALSDLLSEDDPLLAA